MEFITNADEAKKIDDISINEIGIPAIVLMEKAALSVYNHIIDKFKTPDNAGNILVVCGMENNGGDGVAVARLLNENDYNVSILLLGDKLKASKEMQCQLQIAENLHLSFVTEYKENEYNIIIDAIFGIGLTRNIVGKYKECIAWINNKNAYTVAIDIPSGINASNAQIMGCAVNADCTITFGTNKLGNIMFPGTEYAGQVIVADIGFPKKVVEAVKPVAYTYTKAMLEKLMPQRKLRTNKGSYGKVLVIAGSIGMGGACYFTAEAAYRMGCGLVRVMTSEDNLAMIKSKLPEAMVSSYETENICKVIEWADVIAIGPGLSLSKASQELVKQILNITDKTVVIDADGLNILSQINIVDKSTYPYSLPSNYIVTPHLKEMSRLINIPVDEIKNNIIDFAMHQKANCTVVLKDARTIVSNGKECYINTTGNNGLATGGSGDVLCGMIAGLAAQDMQPFEAAKLAVFIHGLAAQNYTSRYSRYTMLASDILKTLPEVIPY